MKSIKEKSKEWCNNHSNKSCTEQCDGCWQLKSAFGCEQHNMELAYKAGANYVVDEIEEIINHPLRFVTSDKTIEEGMIEEISKLVERLKEK